jgi:ribose transport system permease protein
MTVVAAKPPSAAVASRHQPIRSLINTAKPYTIYAAFVALVALFSLSSPVFFSEDNFLNIGRQTALVTIIAVGMTFVIIAGEIDLSVASVLALSGMTSAWAITHIAGSAWIGFIVALCTGAVIGAVNGLLTTAWAVPSFLVTLGMLGIARGAALLMTNTRPISVDNPFVWALFGDGFIFGVPSPIVWTVLVIAIGFVALHLSAFGRRIYACGGNPTAARYSGINVKRTKIAAFVLTGALAGFAGLILAARSHAARPDIAQGLELDVIAAVILGGTSLFGGKGLIVGTLLGSLMIGVLNNGLTLLGVSSPAQLMVKGAIIIAAVALTRR